MDLMMERTEKTTEAMGMEGRQATLYHASPDYHQIRLIHGQDTYLCKAKPFNHVDG
jgi:hypothetical protein